jgi:DNA-binding transcriptional LysR family regulator
MTVGTNSGWLASILSGFLRRYPEVRLEISSTGRVVDLVEERFDLAIRAGALSDSSLVARSLGVGRWFLVATAAYLRKRGRPKTPDDLKEHDCLLFGSGPNAATLRLESGDRSAEVALAPGIASLPAHMCVDDLRARKLERVLRDWNLPPAPIHVVYPTARHVSAGVKTFIEHLQREMTPPPWELGPLP